jgi:hypothetical protein
MDYADAHIESETKTNKEKKEVEDDPEKLARTLFVGNVHTDAMSKVICVSLETLFYCQANRYSISRERKSSRPSLNSMVWLKAVAFVQW